MTKEEVYEKIEAIIVERLGADKDKISRDTSFQDDLGADSLDVVELV
ncbi:MAG: acyl carrier protein, partial [Alkalibacterium sp.]|nr:acyl carrier protein [Alkalibacterium sp.]